MNRQGIIWVLLVWSATLLIASWLPGTPAKPLLIATVVCSACALSLTLWDIYLDRQPARRR